VLFPKHAKHLVSKAKSGILNDTPKVLIIWLRTNRQLQLLLLWMCWLL
jgi:hypothetical protein